MYFSQIEYNGHVIRLESRHTRCGRWSASYHIADELLKYSHLQALANREDALDIALADAKRRIDAKKAQDQAWALRPS